MDAAEAAGATEPPAAGEAEATAGASIGERLLKLAAEPQPPSPDGEEAAGLFSRLGSFNLGDRGEQVMGRLGGAAEGARRRTLNWSAALERTASNLENSALMQRTKAATQRGLASVANAAESAALAAAQAAAHLKARRAAYLSARAFLESQAHARPVLPVVAACVYALSVSGLECEGIFAVAGSPDVVMKLALCFKANPHALVPMRTSPADVAAFLKSYLTSLPAPLLPFGPLCKPGYPDSRRALEALDAATPAGAATAELVLLLAGRLASVSPATKMDAAKLARELAPCLTRRQELPEGAPADAAPSPAEEQAQDAAVVAALRWMIAAGSKSSGALDEMQLMDE